MGCSSRQLWEMGMLNTRPPPPPSIPVITSSLCLLPPPKIIEWCLHIMMAFKKKGLQACKDLENWNSVGAQLSHPHKIS